MRFPGDAPALIGVVHLMPLPGAPRPSPGLAAVVARAVADARALAEGGCDAIVVENLGDAPFVKGRVDAFTVAAMTRVAVALREAAALPLGVNVLRNDVISALSVAAAADAAFVRVNVHTGAMLTDQGVIEGDARATLLERNRIAPGVKLAADVHVKHAVPLAPMPLEDAAIDTAERGLADAVIVTGRGTGRPTDLAHVRAVRRVVHVPVWVGSGVTPETAPALKGLVDAVIVGTFLHRDGHLDAPVDPRRVEAVRRALR